ncbi:nickel ABC transporter substrate-binding protein [Solidesulfovibrio magneticus]|uniref:Nickel ABC transporter substrate binding protein n=1 Tax=Solidesulfovibrio magneticus (strain ATCC 700980 / DSM 13731 / RS-1) TaxID=573370 RepID=C4XLV7_SOLM1|nr:nickel ABC transporter substrate-binding protein [Solidesulfovibrio magneticus]BAH74695.1 nickel ABC transporter substrate binding protein precursor [Solidesulfovibrio magneticus RS-1]
MAIFFRVLALALLLAVPAAPALAGGNELVFSWQSNCGPLNPHLYSPNQMYAQNMLYEPLVRYAEGGKIVPWLAERWDISPDGRTYTFHLRQGVTFSDGTPFDAAAVKANFEAVRKNLARHKWLELVNQLDVLEAPDPATFVMKLKSPYYPALQELSLIRPLRFASPAVFPEDGDTSKGLKKAVGTGPWLLTETKLGEYDLFIRNDKYWGKKPALERVRVKVISDPNARLTAYETGDVDLIYGSGGHASGQIGMDAFKLLAADKANVTGISGPLGTRALCLNSGRGPTRDLAVRQAVAHAVDKAALVKGVFLDVEKPADTLFASDIPYCDLKLPPFALDPAKAEKLLDDAGWKLPKGASVRQKDGQDLEIDLCFIGNDALQKFIAELMQGELAKVGMRIRLVGEESDAFGKRQHDGDFGIIFNDTSGPPYEPHAVVGSMRSPSHADYQAQVGLPMKANIDAKITQALTSTDEDKRAALYKDILTTLHEQAVYLPLTNMTNIVVHRQDVTDPGFMPTKYEIPFEGMTKR